MASMVAALVALGHREIAFLAGPSTLFVALARLAGYRRGLDEVARDLNELVKLSSTLHTVTRMTLTGHADSQGQGTSNLSMSMARAEAVRALLKKRGVDPDLLQVRGAGQLEPVADDTPAAAAAARSANRRVSLSIGFEEEP